MRFATVLCLGSILCACSHTQTVVRPSAPTANFLSTDGYYVAMPPDGTFETKSYAGSGRKTAEIVRTELARRAERVEIGLAQENSTESRAKATAAGLTYAVLPSILHWEDRATEWSGRTDKVTIRMVVVRAATGEEVDSANIEGESRALSFGGDHPEELLAVPVGQYFDALFR